MSQVTGAPTGDRGSEQPCTGPPRRPGWWTPSLHACAPSGQEQDHLPHRATVQGGQGRQGVHSQPAPRQPARPWVGAPSATLPGLLLINTAYTASSPRRTARAVGQMPAAVSCQDSVPDSVGQVHGWAPPAARPQGPTWAGPPKAASLYQLTPSAEGTGEPGEHPAAGPLLPALTAPKGPATEASQQRATGKDGTA